MDSQVTMHCTNLAQCTCQCLQLFIFIYSAQKDVANYPSNLSPSACAGRSAASVKAGAVLGRQGLACDPE